MKTSIFAAAFVAALAGCTSVKTDSNVLYDTKDPVIGNWGLRLPYDSMSAGHAIFTRDAKGKPQAQVLWRWGSPMPAGAVTIDGDKFSFTASGCKVSGTVSGMKLTATVTDKSGKSVGEVLGWRNPPIPVGVSTKDAKFGEPIDLLANGLDGWKIMDPKAKNGWKFKDGVLSNALGLRPDGKWAGGGSNLISKRADFYDFNLEYDVRVPARSNSGVYLRGRYEIQVVDSYKRKVDKHNMAALYGRVTPRVAAERKPGERQHVSVTLYRHHLTVVLNGTTIIEDAPVEGVTGGAIDAEEFVPGPLYLQGDHSDADFRNMILRKAVN